MTFHVVIAPDDNVVAPAGVLLNSIAMHNRAEDYTIHVLHAQLSHENLTKLTGFAASIGMRVHDYKLAGDELEALHAAMYKGHVTMTALARCHIASVLPDEIEKVLYLDTDTLVINSLEPLFATDLGDCIAGACHNPNAHRPVMDGFGVSQDAYFNSGVMLIDMQRWREADVGMRALEFMATHPEVCRYWDQCALNVILQGNARLIDSRWNYFLVSTLALPFHRIDIIHYAGTRKPWVDAARHPLGLFYTNASRDTPFEVEYVFPKGPSAPLAKRLKKSVMKRVKRLLA